METKLNEVTAKTASCSEHLTFEQYLRTEFDAATEAVQDGTAGQDDLDLPIEELIIALVEDGWLPEIRSEYELLGFVYYLVTFDACDFEFYQAAEELWEMYKSARDNVRS